MPSRPILVRVALAVVLMAALVALADVVARRHELRQAIGATIVASAGADEQPAGASDE